MPPNQRVSQYPIPDTSESFERLCKELYGAAWNDPTIMIMGRSGQEQAGVDVLGHDGRQGVGIQCKCYTTTKLSVDKINEEIAKAERAALDIGHLIIATTLPNDSKLVRHIHDLNQVRRPLGQFVVSLAPWPEIESLLNHHPHVARHYDPRHPSSMQSQLLEQGEQTRQGVSDIGITLSKVNGALQDISAVAARGDEADTVTARLLDQIRDCLSAGDAEGAAKRLESLGDPAKLRDSFSRFRWHINRGTVHLLNRDPQKAANLWLQAFAHAPDHEKAHGNRVQAYMLLEEYDRAAEYCQQSLTQFPHSTFLWRLSLTLQDLRGEGVDEAEIPADVRNLPDVLFARALALSRADQPAPAVALYARCMDAEPAGLDYRRAHLAEVLTWLDKTKIQSHFGNLLPEQRTALDRAVGSFEPIEATLGKINCGLLQEELYNNLAAALRIRGNTNRSATLVSHGWQLGLHNEGMLRLRLRELEDADDFAGIKALLQSQLPSLSSRMLMLAAQHASNAGDLPWFTEIEAALVASAEAESLLDEMNALRVNTLWRAQGADTAIAEAAHLLESRSDNLLLRILLARCLDDVKRRNEAVDHAIACLNILDKDACSEILIYQLAELLYDLDEFHAATPLYERLVVVPGDDPLTRRLGRCLIDTDQRQKAQALLTALPPEARQEVTFLQIEANLANAIGDIPRMLVALEKLHAEQPGSARLTLHYAIAAYQAHDEPRLHTLLQSAPFFSGDPDVEFEFAKLQRAHGYEKMALQRVYRAFRQHPVDARAAGYFQILYLQASAALVEDQPTIAEAGCALTLIAAGESRELMLDDKDNTTAQAWPECVNSHTPFGQSLIGKRVNDVVTLPGAITLQPWTIARIERLWGFASRKALRVLETTPNNPGPIWSVRLARDDGQIDMDRILQFGAAREDTRRHQFELYKNGRLTLGLLAQILGADIPSLLLSWPADMTALMVGGGSVEERELESQTLTQGPRLVVDLVTLLEVQRRGLNEALCALVGKPLIPQTTVNQLDLFLRQPGLLSVETANSPRSGQRYTQALPLIHDAYEFVQGFCEVVPVRGPDQVADQTQRAGLLLDRLSFDTLLLAQEHQVALLTDDSKFRSYAREAGVPAVSLQGVMAMSAHRQLMDPLTHAHVLLDKLRDGHRFISFSATNLIELAAVKPGTVSTDVLTIVQSFRAPRVELTSAFNVASDFLFDRFQAAPLDVFATYAEQLEQALLTERPWAQAWIRRWMRGIISIAIQAIKRDRPAADVSRLESLSAIRPSDPGSDLAMAINRIIAEW